MMAATCHLRRSARREALGNNRDRTLVGNNKYLHETSIKTNTHIYAFVLVNHCSEAMWSWPQETTVVPMTVAGGKPGNTLTKIILCVECLVVVVGPNQLQSCIDCSCCLCFGIDSKEALRRQARSPPCEELKYCECKSDSEVHSYGHDC